MPFKLEYQTHGITISFNVIMVITYYTIAPSIGAPIDNHYRMRVKHIWWEGESKGPPSPSLPMASRVNGELWCMFACCVTADPSYMETGPLNHPCTTAQVIYKPLQL